VERTFGDVSSPLVNGIRLSYDSWYVPFFSRFQQCLFVLLVATSVDVERVFSRGHLVLSHVQSRLSAQSTRVLICLGSWSLKGLVMDSDILAVGSLADVEGDEVLELGVGWDHIDL
jgi:hypothetical protein